MVTISKIRKSIDKLKYFIDHCIFQIDQNVTTCYHYFPSYDLWLQWFFDHIVCWEKEDILWSTGVLMFGNSNIVRQSIDKPKYLTDHYIFKLNKMRPLWPLFFFIWPVFPMIQWSQCLLGKRSFSMIYRSNNVR